MAIKAGERVTAGRLGWDSDATPLSLGTLTAASTWTRIGTETLRFPNPGVAVKIRANLVGALRNSTSTSVSAYFRVAISVDGGTTYTTGSEVGIFVGTTEATWMSNSAMAHVSGTPTGDIVVRGEFFSANTNTTANTCYLSADVFPQ